jgi:hypothetical protein
MKSHPFAESLKQMMKRLLKVKKEKRAYLDMEKTPLNKVPLQKQTKAALQIRKSRF